MAKHKNNDSIPDQPSNSEGTNKGHVNPEIMNTYKAETYIGAPEVEDGKRNHGYRNKNFPGQNEVPGSMMGLDGIHKPDLKEVKKGHFTERRDAEENDDTKGMNAQENA
jgi:hypothetical protein